MRDNYIFRAFFSAPTTILGGIFLFIAGVVFGPFLLVLIQGFLGHGEVDSILDFIIFLIVSTGWGMLSGVGLILLFVDYWYIYRLMYKDEPAVTFFLVIAANQVGLILCASLISGMLQEEWLGCVLAWLVLGLLYWGAKSLNQQVK